MKPASTNTQFFFQESGFQSNKNIRHLWIPYLETQQGVDAICPYMEVIFSGSDEVEGICDVSFTNNTECQGW